MYFYNTGKIYQVEMNYNPTSAHRFSVINIYRIDTLAHCAQVKIPDNITIFHNRITETEVRKLVDETIELFIKH